MIFSSRHILSAGSALPTPAQGIARCHEFFYGLGFLVLSGE
jgi:hypothetical protein